jgi:hypothetical protein
MFTSTFDGRINVPRGKRLRNPSKDGMMNSYRDVKLSLEEHLYSSETGELIVFTESLYLYIPSVIVFAIFVWIFNDKIKAH